MTNASGLDLVNARTAADTLLVGQSYRPRVNCTRVGRPPAAVATVLVCGRGRGLVSTLGIICVDTYAKS